MKTWIKCLYFLGILILNPFKVFSQEKQFQNEKFVIVLDVQQCWTEKSLSVQAAGEMLKSINSLIGISDPVKVIYIKSIARVATLSFKGIKIDTLPDQDFDTNLLIVNTSAFIKTEGDAFATREIVNFLNQNNAKEIIITGMLAERCVTKTALGGVERKYNIYITPDAIGAQSGKSKAKTIRKLMKAGVKTCDINVLKNG